MVGSQTSQQAPLAEQILTMLSAEERCAITLRHARSMGVAQIAACMGCPRRAAEKALRTAEAKVRAAQRAFLEALLELARAPARAERISVEPKPRERVSPVSAASAHPESVSAASTRPAATLTTGAPRARAKSAPVAEKHAKVGAIDGAVAGEVARA